MLDPDVFCNKEIKFNQFYKYALSQGFDLIATGHYAKKINNKNAELHSPKDKVKDQTYFLYTMNKTVLKNTIFPYRRPQQMQFLLNPLSAWRACEAFQSAFSGLKIDNRYGANIISV